LRFLARLLSPFTDAKIQWRPCSACGTSCPRWCQAMEAVAGAPHRSAPKFDQTQVRWGTSTQGLSPSTVQVALATVCRREMNMAAAELRKPRIAAHPRTSRGGSPDGWPRSCSARDSAVRHGLVGLALFHVRRRARRPHQRVLNAPSGTILNRWSLNRRILKGRDHAIVLPSRSRAFVAA